MVILYSREGRLANRMWQAAHFIGNALEYDYRFLHLGFGEYLKYFEENEYFRSHPDNHFFVDFINNSISRKLLFKYIKLSQNTYDKFYVHLPFISNIRFQSYRTRYDLSNKDAVTHFKKNITLMTGWFFEDKSSLLTHSDRIRSIFTPNEQYQLKIEKTVKEIFSTYDVVIGVHIRRGDYSTYKNGIWFYTNGQYLNFLNQISRMPAFVTKSIGYFISSDEVVNEEGFEGYNTIILNNNLIEDLYTLAMCNYIIGPPSTFSSWASFYGQVPLIHLTSCNMTLEENMFGVVQNC